MDEESRENLFGPRIGPKQKHRLTDLVRVIGFLALTGFLTTFYIISSENTKRYVSILRETSGEYIIQEGLAREGQDQRDQQPGGKDVLQINPDQAGAGQKDGQDDQPPGAHQQSANHKYMASPDHSELKKAWYVFLDSDPDEEEANQTASQKAQWPATRLNPYPNTTTEKDVVNMTGYLVYSPSCRMPDTPPFHETVKHLYEKKTEPPCSLRPPLTSVSRSLFGNVLYFHKELFATYQVKSASCCYTRIWRTELNPYNENNDADNKVSYGNCIEFHDNVMLNGDDEFIQVTCDVMNGTELTTIYENMHAFVGWKPPVERKMGDANRDRSTQKTLSVMIIGLDNVSRKNLIRTMPETVEYLDSNGWIGLKGHNKIGENTFPNLLATLAGMSVQQVTDTCWPSRTTPLDECQLIWENFSQKGYITAYAEDEPDISSFNYFKAGFKKSPTDYYLRPFMQAAAKLTTNWYENMAGCIGPVTPTQHILNYSINFATTFREFPTFSVFWLNGMHEDLNRPTTLDDHMRSYFEKHLNDSGTLNTTMVIFMSDHGMRFGEIRETYIGYIEERLPFVYFWLPEWFKTAYPTKVNYLTKNTNRLTSPYDIYMTLAEALGVQTVAQGCPTCASLFKEVPWNRSCADAGIPEHWCTCTETITTGTGPIQAIAEFVVESINHIVKEHTNYLESGTRCAELRVKNVLSFRRKIFSDTGGFEEFVIIVQTVPGEGEFEATVGHVTTYKIIDYISRINYYGNKGKCINNYYAKQYCYCESVSGDTSSNEIVISW